MVAKEIPVDAAPVGSDTGVFPEAAVSDSEPDMSEGETSLKKSESIMSLVESDVQSNASDSKPDEQQTMPFEEKPVMQYDPEKQTMPVEQHPVSPEERWVVPDGEQAMPDGQRTMPYVHVEMPAEKPPSVSYVGEPEPYRQQPAPYRQPPMPYEEQMMPHEQQAMPYGQQTMPDEQQPVMQYEPDEMAMPVEQQAMLDGEQGVPYDLQTMPDGDLAMLGGPAMRYGQQEMPDGDLAMLGGPAMRYQQAMPYGDLAMLGGPTMRYQQAMPYGDLAMLAGPTMRYEEQAMPAEQPPSTSFGQTPDGQRAIPYGQPAVPYDQPELPAILPSDTTIIPCRGLPALPYGQGVIRYGTTLFPCEGLTVLPYGQAVIRYGQPLAEEVFLRCVEPTYTDVCNRAGGDASMGLQTTDITDAEAAIALADAALSEAVAREGGQEGGDWLPPPGAAPWQPPFQPLLRYVPNSKSPYPFLPRILRPMLEYEPAPRTRCECLVLVDKIRGHQRAPSGSREFKELTKRDAQVQLQQELHRLLDTSSEAHRALAQRQLDGFTRLFERFLREEGPSVQWENIEKLPENAVIDYSTLNTPSVDIVHDMLGKLVVVKLNGGLGTSMGCHGPKSVIPVRSDLTFLDLTVQQIEHLNKTYKANVPLVLMDSFNTDEDTQKIIRKYKGLQVEIYTFNQSCYPRINRDSLLPIAKTCDVNEDMEAWYPPGHGDFYYSFQESGLLKRFLEDGRKYCFISNIDNLGATVDLNILDLLMNPTYGDATPEFVMEITDKTRADVKGGTLIQYEGKLRLLEIAQVPKEHVDDFKSVKTFKFFNTNNLWAKLDAIERVLTDNTLNMEVIINNKTLENGLNIIQLETAVGAAMKSFDGGLGINVPRSRFLPVKKTSDLLLVMSNLYNLQNGSLAMSPERMFPTTPFVKLGDNHFSKVKEFLARFANIPDLMELDHLTVSGDVTFGRGVILKGTVIIIANHGDRIDIPSGSVLENKIVSGNMRILDH